MTTNAKWEGQLTGNRADYLLHVNALCTPVNLDLVQRVMRMEHIVAELSGMAVQSSGKVTPTCTVAY